MPFTALELENIANAVIDFHMDQGKIWSQTIQDKPLLKAMESAKKTFPGGKENITVRVKGTYTTDIEGYSEDDEVSYGNPANIKTASFPWKEWHSGIKVTMTELKKDGISVNDSTTGKNTSEHSGREKTALANLLEDKVEDMAEGTARGENLMYWRDGTLDSKLAPGVRSFILDNPASATVVAGIDQSTNTWWRNRSNVNLAAALLTGGAINVATPANQLLVTALQREMRQLRRYGAPKHLALAGSDFLDAFEQELRAKGNYTLDGWSKSGRIDASVADLAFKGVNLEYDPTLDDEGLSKYLFLLDTKHIFPMMMEGEDKKRHAPARPENQYVIHRAVTSTGGLVCRKRNSSGVYWIS